MKANLRGAGRATERSDDGGADQPLRMLPGRAGPPLVRPALAAGTIDTGDDADHADGRRDRVAAVRGVPPAAPGMNVSR